MDETADATREQRKKRIQAEMAAEEDEREKKKTAKEQKGDGWVLYRRRLENESTREIRRGRSGCGQESSGNRSRLRPQCRKRMGGISSMRAGSRLKLPQQSVQS